jgi:CubicO group peptidase (beta-lactamase class C family)
MAAVPSLAWRRVGGLLLLAVALIPVLALAASRGPPPGLAELLDEMIRQDGAPGVTVMAFRDGRLLFRLDRGRIAPDARLPVASASKWMAAALVMTLVDEGKLSLDEPIGPRLPEFTGPAGAITLRQILSYTSGQGSLKGLVDVRQPPDLSLRESARRIAALPLADPPGAVFKYGSPAFQIAGALAEQATGQTWAALFEARIARPLGMSHTSWGAPLNPGLPPEAVRNPNLQGGVVTTADDYARFLGMIAAGGEWGGRRILSAGAVAEMARAQTLGKSMAFMPGGAEAGLQYGLGEWCEAVGADGDCTVVSSPGALGTYPWIDRRSGVYGLFFMNRRLPLVEQQVQAARRLIEQAATRPDR